MRLTNPRCYLLKKETETEKSTETAGNSARGRSDNNRKPDEGVFVCVKIQTLSAEIKHVMCRSNCRCSIIRLL